MKLGVRSSAGVAHSSDRRRFGAGSISEVGREIALLIEATSLVVGVVVEVQAFTNHRSRGIIGSISIHTSAILIVGSLIHDGSLTIISAVVGTVASFKVVDIRW